MVKYGVDCSNPLDYEITQKIFLIEHSKPVHQSFPLMKRTAADIDNE